jgi:hypothetical protein
VNFLSEYLTYTNHYESPGSFWKWSGYAIVAAVLRDNCYRLAGDIKICANTYTLLLADSAVQRKDNPIDLCELFVKSIDNTKIISGRGSIQGIIDELQRAETDPRTGRIIKGGSAIFIASELSAALVQDPQSINILTDLYKYRDEYSERLRGRQDKFKVKNVCFSMFSASNKDLLLDVYDVRAMRGGLLGRTFLVTPNEFRPANSLFNVVKKAEQFEWLKKELTEISKLRGEFKFEADAESTYNDWYTPFRESYREKGDASGIAGRIHTGILKLAMILCVIHTKALCVQKSHIEEAIEECIALMPNYNQFLMASGKSKDNSEIGTIIITELYNSPNHELTREKIFQKHWNAFDAEQFDKLMSTLTQAKLVMETNEGNKQSYRLTEKCKEMLFKK